LASLLHSTLVVGVSQTAAFNRGRHLYSAGRPSGWALAHISSCVRFSFFSTMPRDWLGRTLPKWHILCWVGRKTFNSISLWNVFLCQVGHKTIGLTDAHFALLFNWHSYLELLQLHPRSPSQDHWGLLLCFWCVILDSADLSLCSAVCRPARPERYTCLRVRAIVSDAAWEQCTAACDDVSTQHAIPTHAVSICTTCSVLGILLLAPRTGPEYCDEHVCMSVCPLISKKSHVQTSSNCLLLVAMARSSLSSSSSKNLCCDNYRTNIGALQ